MNRQACAPYMRVPPPTVIALLPQAGEEGGTSPDGVSRGSSSAAGPELGGRPRVARGVVRWSSISRSRSGQVPRSTTRTRQPASASTCAAMPPPAPEPMTTAS